MRRQVRLTIKPNADYDNTGFQHNENPTRGVFIPLAGAAEQCPYQKAAPYTELNLIVCTRLAPRLNYL